MRVNIRKLDDIQDVRNASGKSSPIVVTIELTVQIGTSTQVVIVILVEKLATSLIVGFNFCDVLVEATKPRLMIVEMDDGYTVPIIRQPFKLNKTVPLSEEQRCAPRKNRSTMTIKITLV